MEQLLQLKDLKKKNNIYIYVRYLRTIEVVKSEAI